MKRVVIMVGLTLTTAVALVLMSGLSAASASGGSDAALPYTVGADGITLPSGFVFADGGHVNVTTDEGAANVHFESKCITRTDAECAGKRHEDAQFIGKSFIPWSAFGLPEFFCVTWVQLSQFSEHFGEGGQEPVCVVDSTPSPEPEPEPTTTPTPKPTVEPTLAETGFDGVEWWHVIVGGVLLAVGMGAVVVADRRGDGE